MTPLTQIWNRILNEAEGYYFNDGIPIEDLNIFTYIVGNFSEGDMYRSI